MESTSAANLPGGQRSGNRPEDAPLLKVDGVNLAYHSSEDTALSGIMQKLLRLQANAREQRSGRSCDLCIGKSLRCVSGQSGLHVTAMEEPGWPCCERLPSSLDTIGFATGPSAPLLGSTPASHGNHDLIRVLSIWSSGLEGRVVLDEQGDLLPSYVAESCPLDLATPIDKTHLGLCAGEVQVVEILPSPINAASARRSDLGFRLVGCRFLMAPFRRFATVLDG
jgi:hypothetical protein